MYLFTIQTAGHLISCETTYLLTYNRCRDFITDGKPELHIRMKQEDIDRERERYILAGGDDDPSDRSLEYMALLRRVSEEIMRFDAFMMHGAVIAVHDAAYLFTAVSGTGKTTHIKKWLAHVPGAFVVNGDKPFIKISDDGTPPLACGSPWAGKENMYTNTMVPLKSIILMERAEENHMEQISFAQAFPTLLQQVYRPDDEEKMRKTLRLMQRLSPAVSFWRFQFNNFKDDCFDVAYNALVKGQP